MMLFESPKFRIRASSIGSIMTDGKGKTKAEKIAELKESIQSKVDMNKDAKDGKMKENRQIAIEKLQNELELLEKTDEELPESVKLYCQDWLKSQEQMYNRDKSFTSKYTEKGNRVESESIEYLDYYYKWTEQGEYVQKNEIYRENDFCCGTADLILASMRKIIDVKNSNNCYTFPLFESEMPTKDYWWQGQGYLELWDFEDFEVIYTLMDMPEDMIAKEARFKLPQFYTEKQYNTFRSQYSYSDLEDWKRIKRFSFKRDRDAIEKIKARVALCQKYINELIKSIELCLIKQP